MANNAAQCKLSIKTKPTRHLHTHAHSHTHRLILLLLLLFLHVFLIAPSLWHSFTRVRIAQANLNFKISTLTAYRSAKINALTHTHTLSLSAYPSATPSLSSLSRKLTLSLSLFAHARIFKLLQIYAFCLPAFPFLSFLLPLSVKL